MTGELLPGGAANQAEFDAPLRCIRAAFLGLVPDHIPTTSIEVSRAQAALRQAEASNSDFQRSTNEPSEVRVHQGLKRGAQVRPTAFSAVVQNALDDWLYNQQKTA